MKILIIVGRYLPGYKGGGPIRSIANMVDQLGDEFRFSIITTDRDMGDQEPYPDIQPGRWYPKGKAQVLYLSPPECSWRNWLRLLRSLDYDLIYLNSYFMRLSIKTLWLRFLRRIPNRPVLIAPRGEFSPGAVALKAYKKRPYIWLTNLIGLSRSVWWHASSEYEASDIRREIFHPLHVVTASVPVVHVAADLSSVEPTVRGTVFSGNKAAYSLRVVFLSRIARKKNLDFALKILDGVDGQVQFDIYGPLEDKTYWRECEHLISRLPTNVQVRYCGPAHPDQVIRIFSQCHIFLFPTRGENFGHVILESLSAGCPVLISDQTMWRGLEQRGVGWDLPLSEPERFRSVLNRCVAMDEAEFEIWSKRSSEYAEAIIAEQEMTVLHSYRTLFRDAVNS